LTKNLQLKLDKSGDTLSGNLNLADYNITCLGNPVNDCDAANKKFVKSELKADSIITKLYIVTLLHQKLDKNITENLNMNGQKIIGLGNPKTDDEVCNKKYLDSNIESSKQESDDLLNNIENRLNLCVQKQEIIPKKLFEIGTVINNFLKEKDITVIKSVGQFLKSFNRLEKMYEKYKDIFEITIGGNIPDVIKSCVYFSDLYFFIIKVIEELPRNIFMELQATLKNFAPTPEPESLQKSVDVL